MFVPKSLTMIAYRNHADTKFLLPQINVISAMIVLIMHKHRFIILRRLALILGLLYGYRAITMFVTNLPKADPNYFCAEKVRYIMSG